jgi:hypothetical protein
MSGTRTPKRRESGSSGWGRSLTDGPKIWVPRSPVLLLRINQWRPDSVVRKMSALFSQILSVAPIASVRRVSASTILRAERHARDRQYGCVR